MNFILGTNFMMVWRHLGKTHPIHRKLETSITFFSILLNNGFTAGN